MGNDAKKKAQEEAAAAAIHMKAEEKVVAAKNAEAKKVAAEAATAQATATKKKNAAEAVLKKIENAACAKHAGCKGLVGYCCPTLNTNKMHLGSTKLDGANLGCCGGATEMADEAADMASADDRSIALDGFGSGAMMLSALCGSAVTLAALRLTTRKQDQSASY